jgi:hypothetical protein
MARVRDGTGAWLKVGTRNLMLGIASSCRTDEIKMVTGLLLVITHRSEVGVEGEGDLNYISMKH